MSFSSPRSPFRAFSRKKRRDDDDESSDEVDGSQSSPSPPPSNAAREKKKTTAAAFMRRRGISAAKQVKANASLPASTSSLSSSSSGSNVAPPSVPPTLFTRATANASEGIVSKKGVIKKSLSTTNLHTVLRQESSTRMYQQFDLSPEQLRTLYPRAKCGVPPVVYACIELLESELAREGIFRICGRKTDILELKIGFEQGEGIPKDANPYTVAGLLSQFIQLLPEPLIPYSLYDGFIKAAAMVSFDKAREQILKMMERLPAANYDLLKYIISFLTRVSAHAETNRMDARNLALVFGASLLNPHPEAPFTLMNVQYQNVLVQLLIENYDALFERRTLSGARLPTLQIGRITNNIATIRAGAEDTVRGDREQPVLPGPAVLPAPVMFSSPRRARVPLMSLANPNQASAGDSVPAVDASAPSAAATATATTSSSSSDGHSQAAIVAAASAALGLTLPSPSRNPSNTSPLESPISPPVSRLGSYDVRASTLDPVSVLISPR